MKYPKTLSFLSGNRNFAELVNRLYILSRRLKSN